MGQDLGCRRDWLLQVAMLAAGGLATTKCATAADDAKANDSADAVLLVADASRSLFRVRVEMDVEGNVNVPRNALVSKERAQQIPLRSKSVLDWEERILGYASDRTVAAAERHYHEANREGTVGKTERRVELRKSSQYLMVRREEPKWLMFSPETYLSGMEWELLELPTSSLAVDGLLPTKPIQSGDTYSLDKEVLAKWLSLASVNDSDVIGEINSLDADVAKIHLKGKVQGSVGGVPTTIDLVGKMVFDRAAMATNWLAVAIREQREIGKSEPGFDVAATVKMIRKPLETPARLSSIPPAAPLGAIPDGRLYLEWSSSAVGFAVLMDRRWKIMSDVPGATMLRMIENDRGVAQCDVRPAGKMAAGTQLTMSAFVGDIKQSLGKRFSQLIESREEVNRAGLRVLRVSAQGAVEGVPVQWVFLHFSDDSGKRLLATMTVGGNDLDAFAGADVQFSASLQFIPTEDELAAVATTATQPARK